MFRRILIANRGEIACRIIRTAQNMGIETVVTYSDADESSLAVKKADHAIYIGQAKPSLSYLNIEANLSAAKKMHVDAIHPGYGFLSENPHFAAACEQANITFIGPSAQAMQCMASKQLAKQLLRKTTVPLTPGYDGADQHDQTLLQEAKKIGFPILLKAAFGGGGKGMRIVHQESEFTIALESARREAQAYFADATLIIEKLIQPARHIEIQVLLDQHQHGVYLFDRDCSLQRRHQKIVEEAPAPNLLPALRKKMGEAALSVAKSIAYYNAGTIEFLLDPDNNFYFMEMNTRLQVEHPVTEMITGIDLVEWQLRIAAGENLSLSQTDLTIKGHAIEFRIYAEDPIKKLPSSGQIDYLSPPTGEGIRLDTGFAQGDFVTTHYDALISKLIIYGDTREQALQRSCMALKNYAISGIKTNLPFLNLLIEQPEFIKGKTCTHFIEKTPWKLQEPNIQEILEIIASVDYLTGIPEDPLWQDTYGWHMHLNREWTYNYLYNDQHYAMTVSPKNFHAWTLKNQQASEVTLTGQLSPHQLILNNGSQKTKFIFVDKYPLFTLLTRGGPVILTRIENRHLNPPIQQINKCLTAPMPATVVALLKKPGDPIKAGENILILEAMKMEHSIQAPQDGQIKSIFYPVGAQVPEGALLIDFSPLE
jgi:3-methylcrotonyl-CoA carboxylase alpha subunit